MTAGWVAATTRGRALLARSLGDSGARSLSNASSWPDARVQLLRTVYGAGLSPTADRESARRAARGATAWQLRVLAGWLPPASGRLARLAAAPFEISNIDHQVARLHGVDAPDPIPLGSLGVAWPRLAAAGSIEQVRFELAHSAWGDPGGIERSMLMLGLRVAWARRVAGAVPSARDWAHGALASLIAGERFVFGRTINDITARELDRLIGRPWRGATTLPELADRLPPSANWAIEGITAPSDVWRSEAAILHRVGHDAQKAANGGPPTAETVAAIMALLLVDLWRATAAIEAAGRGPHATEVLDAVA